MLNTMKRWPPYTKADSQQLKHYLYARLFIYIKLTNIHWKLNNTYWKLITDKIGTDKSRLFLFRVLKWTLAHKMGAINSFSYPKVLLRSSNPIKNNLKVHLQNSQWQRSHSDWTERPEASKENFGLDGRSSFQEKYSLKEAPPVLKLALILLNMKLNCMIILLPKKF